MMCATTLEDLQKNWPGWSVRQGGTLWKATRRKSKPDVPEGFLTVRGDLAETLIEDGPRELLAALENQAAIEEEIAAFLAVAR